MTDAVHGVPPLVAVHGRRRSGKGTIAEYLVSRHGFRTIKFAEPLKEMLCKLLLLVGVPEDLIERCIEGDLKECPVGLLGGRSTRFAMQSIGTEWRDLIITDLWLSIAVRRVRDLVAAGIPVVIDDLRFPFEMEHLVAEDARLWMVTNSRADAIASAPPSPDDMLRLARGSSFDFTQVMAREMVAVLLRFCSVPEAMVFPCIDGELRDAPVAMLGGRTGHHALATLLVDWKGMMDRGPDARVSALASHSSEQVLPAGRFHAIIPNEGSFGDLHDRVDAALMAGLAAAA